METRAPHEKSQAAGSGKAVPAGYARIVELGDRYSAICLFSDDSNKLSSISSMWGVDMITIFDPSVRIKATNLAAQFDRIANYHSEVTEGDGDAVTVKQLILIGCEKIQSDYLIPGGVKVRLFKGFTEISREGKEMIVSITEQDSGIGKGQREVARIRYGQKYLNNPSFAVRGESDCRFHAELRALLFYGQPVQKAKEACAGGEKDTSPTYYEIPFSHFHEPLIIRRYSLWKRLKAHFGF